MHVLGGLGEPVRSGLQCGDVATTQPDNTAPLPRVSHKAPLLVPDSWGSPVSSFAYLSICSACSWTTTERAFSQNYAGGDSTESSLADAKTRCVDMAPSVCRAVTCSSNRGGTSSGCTIRAGAQPFGSSSHETTYTPTNCRTTGKSPQFVKRWSELRTNHCDRGTESV